MRLVITCPPIHHFHNDDGSVGGPEFNQYWHNWGWCNLGELLHHLHVQHELRWTRQEFFRRFWCSPMRASSRDREITVLIRYRGDFEIIKSIIPGEMSIVNSKQSSVFVPAGFAKAILFEIGWNGGRRIVSAEHGLALADETSNIICQY